MRERNAVKVARSVLRGGTASNVCPLPDYLYRNIEIIEGAVCSDHVHLCLSIPPSEKVSDVVGYIKGKSALMIHDKYPEMTNGWTKAFWARGYYVATVGNITEEAVKEYIQRQKEESKREDTRK